MRKIFLLIIFFFIIGLCFSQDQIQVTLSQPPPNQLRATDLWKAILVNTSQSTIRIKLSGTLAVKSEGIVVNGQSGIMSLPPGTKRITYDDVKTGDIDFKSGKWSEAFYRTGKAPSGDYTICIVVKAEDGRELGSSCIDQTITTIVPEDVTPNLTVKLIPPPPNLLRSTDLWKIVATSASAVAYNAYLITVELKENTTGIQVESKLRSVVISGSKSFLFNDFNTADLTYHNTKLQEAYGQKKNAPDGNYTICVYVNNERGDVVASDCIDQTITTEVPVDITPHITVKLIPPPSNQLKSTDLWRIIVTNASAAAYNAALISVDLKEKNTGLQVESKLRSVVISGSKSFSFSDFNSTELTYRNTKLQEAYGQKKNAPDGNYTLCVYVKNEKGDVVVSDCIDQTITSIIPEVSSLQLVSPADGSTLDSNQPILFTWTFQSNKFGTDLSYKIKIVEILGSQSQENAIKQNPAWFEKNDISTPMFHYPASAKKIEKNKKYAWTVQLINRKGPPIIENSVSAEVYMFSIDKDIVEDKAETISLQLVSPADGSILDSNQPVFFTWMLTSLKPNTPIIYKIKVVEILGNQSTSEAIQLNPVWFERADITTMTLIYPIAARKLVNGKKYAWQITPYMKNAGIGKSEIWSFVFGSEVTSEKITETKQCDVFKVEFKKIAKGDTISYKLLITNNYKGTFSGNKPGSFRITLKNDSVSSIAGGVSEGWKRTPSKFPPGSSGVKWTKNSGDIPNDTTDLGNLVFRDIYSKPIKVVYEWLDKEESLICKDSSTFIESSFYYELTTELPNNSIDVSGNFLNIQYANNYASIGDLIISIYNIEKYEIVKPTSAKGRKTNSTDKENKHINSNGLNRISIDLKEYALQPKTTYLLVVANSKNNYYLNFKVTNQK